MADMFDADDTMVDEAKPAEEMSKADICALALLQATNDFVEALQQISFPHGRDAETELDRALDCYRLDAKRGARGIAQARVSATRRAYLKSRSGDGGVFCSFRFPAERYDGR